MANIKDITSGTVQPGDNSIVAGTPAKPQLPPDSGIARMVESDLTMSDVLPEAEPATLRSATGEIVTDVGEATKASMDYQFNGTDYYMKREAAMSADPEQSLLEWETAKALSKKYPVNPLDISKNIDQYLKDYWGEAGGAGLKSAPQAVADSLLAGIKVIELGWAGSAAWLDESKDADVQRIQQEIMALNTDKIPRDWWTSGWKVFGNIAPYTLYAGASTFLAGLATGGMGSAAQAANVTKGALIMAKAIRGLDFAHSAVVMNGLAYADLTSKGIDRDVARRVSPFVGVLNTVIERGFGAGIEGAYRRAGVGVGEKIFGKEAVEAVTKKAAAKFLASGGMDTIAAVAGKELLKTTIGESVEESGQSLVEGVAMMIAESLSEEAGAPVIDRTTALEVFGGIAEAFTTSLVVAPILGAPAAILTGVTSVGKAKKMSATMKALPPEVAVEVLDKDFNDSNIPPEVRLELAQNLYEQGQQEEVISNQKLREAAKERVAEGQVAPDRTETGDIAFSENITSEENGKTTVEYNAGPVNSPHATVEFELDGDRLVIVAADFKDEYRGIADELVQQIAAEYPTKEIVVEDLDLIDPSLAGAYERAIKMGPTGKASWVATGDTASEAEAKQRFRSSIARTGKIGLAQQELTIHLTERLAKAGGMSFSQFTRDLKGFAVDEMLDKAGKVGSLETVKDAARSAQYIIKLGEQANFSTVVHELGHFARKTIKDKSVLKPLENLYGIQNGQWEPKHEEQFTNDLMEYIATGKVKDESVRGVFQRIAEFIAQTWNRVLSKANMKPEIEAAFDKFFGVTETQEEVVAEEPIVAQEEPVKTFDETLAEKSPDEQEELKAGIEEIKGMVGDDGPLFMSAEEIKRTSASVKESVEQSAAKYKTVEDWIAAQGKEYSKLDAKEQEWVKGIFDQVKGGKKMKPGELAKMLTGDKLIDFLTETADTIYATPESEIAQERTRAVRDAVSGSPILKRAVDKVRARQSFTAGDINEIQRYIGANEAIVKMLYGRVTNDARMVYEGAVQTGMTAPLSKKAKSLGVPGITIAEQEEIVREIKDENIRNKINSNTITVADLDAYIKSIKAEAVAKAKGESEKKFASRMAEYKKKVAERDAARKMRALLLKKRKFIMQKVPGSVDAHGKRFIEFIQQYLKGKQKGQINLSDLKALQSTVFRTHPEMVQRLKDMVDRVSDKKFSEWSMYEVDSLARTIKNIIAIGKAERASQRLAYTELRDAYIQHIMDAMGGPAAVYESGSEEYKKQQKKANRIYDDMNIERFCIQTKIGKELLYDQMVNRMRDKHRHISDRTVGIKKMIENDKIIVNGKEKKIIDALHDTVIVEGVAGIAKEKATWTRSKLMGAYLLVGTKDDFNQSQLEAFVFGNLFSLEERKKLGNDKLMDMLQERADIIRAAAEKELTDGEKKLAGLMRDALNEDAAWDRFHRAVYLATGRDMAHERAYFPMVFANGIKSDDPILAAAAEAFGNGVLDMGITYDRSHVSPENRRELDHDAVRLFYDSTSHQEHISAFAEYLKTVKSVFGGASKESASLRQQIEARNGRNATKYLDNYMDIISQTGDFNRKELGSDFVNMFRGGVVVAALGYRLSSVLMQLGTSPLPFLQEVSPAALMSEYASMMSAGPEAYLDTAEAKSPILRARLLESLKEIERMEETGLQGKMKKAGQVGMLGIHWADRISVAAGWNAVYKQKLKEYSEKSDPDIAMAKAIDYADKVVIRTQPSSENLFRAPMYQNMGFFKRMFLQFTQPLNVVWQNTRYDIPEAIRQGEVRKAVMIATAYALSGAVMGTVWALRGRGPEEDESWLAYYAWAMSSQFTDAVPIAGEAITQITRAVALNEPYRPFSGQQLPVMESGLSAISSVLNLRDGWNEEAAMKAAYNTSRAAGYALGLPVAGAKEVTDMANSINRLVNGE